MRTDHTTDRATYVCCVLDSSWAAVERVYGPFLDASAADQFGRDRFGENSPDTGPTYQICRVQPPGDCAKRAGD